MRRRQCGEKGERKLKSPVDDLDFKNEHFNLDVSETRGWIGGRGNKSASRMFMKPVEASIITVGGNF